MKIRQYILELHIMNIKHAHTDIQMCSIHIYCGEIYLAFVTEEIKTCVIDVTRKSHFKFKYSNASTCSSF